MFSPLNSGRLLPVLFFGISLSMSSDVRKILCFVVALSTLVIGFSGCQSRKEQRLASYKALCESREHKVNSAKYWDCIDTQELKRASRVGIYGVVTK